MQEEDLIGVTGGKSSLVLSEERWAELMKEMMDRWK